MRGTNTNSAQDLAEVRGEGSGDRKEDSGVSEMVVLRVKLEEAEQMRDEAEATVKRIQKAIEELQHQKNQREEHHGSPLSVEVPLQSPLQLLNPLQGKELQSVKASTSKETNIKEEGEDKN